MERYLKYIDVLENYNFGSYILIIKDGKKELRLLKSCEELTLLIYDEPMCECYLYWIENNEEYFKKVDFYDYYRVINLYN